MSRAGMLSGPTTPRYGMQSLRSPWHCSDSQRNIGHDGRFSALGVRPADLQTTIMSVQREARVDSQAPLRMLTRKCPRDLPSQRCPLDLPPVIREVPWHSSRSALDRRGLNPGQRACSSAEISGSHWQPPCQWPAAWAQSRCQRGEPAGGCQSPQAGPGSPQWQLRARSP